MTTRAIAHLALVLAIAGGCSRRPQAASNQTGKASAAKPERSSQCKSCHPAFYKKWASSHHGLAMQPFTPEFAASSLGPQPEPLRIGDRTYLANLNGKRAFIEERGPGGSRQLAIEHVLGGKNVYYFLTPMERGRLQVLPLAYDIQKKAWYDMAASGVRMHSGGLPGQALDWTDPFFTFNTACYSCHVSQLKTNYDVASDTYHTTWREPGIDCETCHGSGDAHVSLYTNNKGEKVPDMKILRITQFTVQQRNDMCAPCHAKMSPISPAYQVTQRFFDHYDLVTLEDADYYPDGRDLGENYTYTSWLMSPCVRSGKLDCIHCHTSSGRYKFAAENQNGACLPCHQERVANPGAHSNHKQGEKSPRCIDCHMPKTRFANMNRSDHSMLPPTPAATVRFKSPNACNLCHKERGAGWADAQVRRWQKRDYQKPVLERARLIQSARDRDWSRLPTMLAMLRGGEDAVFKASLLRLLQGCDDPKKWPAVLECLRDRSPLVRASAAGSIGASVTADVRAALVQAAKDDYRLVRIRAAAALASVPVDSLPEADQAAVKKATGELIGAYNARPDDFANHTNLGNFYMERGDLDSSIRSFETALRLRPDSVGTLVNASMAYSRANRMADAERVLEQALKHAPDNAPALFNRGLLLAETGRTPEATRSLQQALKSDPTLAPAAYNLCVLLVQRNPSEGIGYCRKAVELAPRAEKHAYSLAFYMSKNGDIAGALTVLERFAAISAAGADTRALMGDLCLKTGRNRQALAHFQAALSAPGISPEQRRALALKTQALRSQ